MLSTTLLPIALLFSAVSSIDVTIWDNKDCHGGTNAIRSLYATPMDCYKRGDFEIDLQIGGRGGMKEQAISAGIKDSVAASQYVVFFSSDDCNPDNVIDNAWLDKGCSSLLPVNPKEYKSWSVWDMCAEPGCSLG
ncbi:hypothetical protein CC86DRAFT_468002 [Ophiobolus disseminans]|uniref:Uncharacterized protein n=1 Tax=Ophiobolus disseminans TaxID=1469910 RepID=A0A6A6ZUZ4_9PLEO|nr:hypothetical protein CC86DRAFT_468002 [Ophiobolus disseminans]